MEGHAPVQRQYRDFESLFWRDHNYINTATYWSRGNGRVVGGVARILDVLPAMDRRRSDYVTLLNQMSAKLAGEQILKL